MARGPELEVGNARNLKLANEDRQGFPVLKRKNNKVGDIYEN